MATNEQWTEMEPRSVNFSAFPNRLSRTCPRRMESPKSSRGTPSSTSTVMRKPFSWARCDTRSVVVLTTSSTLNRVGCSSSFPASILEKSRMSFTRAKSEVPASWIFSTYPFWCAFSPSRRSRCESPMMAFMGVWISWLMVARNIDFAAAASTARFLASSISSSLAVRSPMFSSPPTMPPGVPSELSKREIQYISSCLTPSGAWQWMPTRMGTPLSSTCRHCSWRSMRSWGSRMANSSRRFPTTSPVLTPNISK